MSGTILENLSGRKLSILVSCLLLCQVACFLVGGLYAPLPSGLQTALGIRCRDTPGRQNDTNYFLYSRGKGSCNQVQDNEIEQDPLKMANQLVYVFQMPLPRDNRVLDYTRWQQNLIGVLQVDIAYDSSTELREPPKELQLTIDTRLAYRNKKDADSDWKLYAHSIEQRYLDCHAAHVGLQETLYHCDMIPLFELGALHHSFYLLNLRFPVDTPKQLNLQFGHMHDIQLTAIHQNGGFTKVWLLLKTLLCPFLVGIMLWFWRRVHILQRKPALLEYMLLYLGGALTFQNLPLEYLSLSMEMPYMLLLGDVRQGIFYAMLLSFWLVFAGEHMLIQDSPNKSTIRSRYWKHLSAVVVGCISLFVFDICERGVQLRNPFYSIWATPVGAKVAMSFIVLAGVSGAIYFLFLCFMVWKVFKDIGDKRTSLPSMSQARRLHYEGAVSAIVFTTLGAAYGTAKSGVGIASMSQKHPELIMKAIIPVVMAGIIAIYGLVVAVLLAGSLTKFYKSYHGFLNLSAGLAVGLSGLAAGITIGVVGDAGVRLIYRFKFLMLATLLCAGLTVAGFFMRQMNEEQWKWNNVELQLTSALHTGVYGTWNVYIIALLILYAPSHKQWPTMRHSDETTQSNENIVASAASEEIEFSHLPSDSNPSEISSLTSFTRKVAFD
ncbi:Vha16-4 [Drosophila busckii]|uniref:Protein wntless n=1 Tax=Drosophila busckii TaxID=30019 RepID=A0A0M5J3N4_DROBS|nr:Vha16-4 [Drosophila busckii]